MKQRYLSTRIQEDLSAKMVFIGGPRQVGKTTLARDLLPKLLDEKFAYYNWDSIVKKRSFLEGSWPAEASLLIFDELHKYRAWKSWVKGVFDLNHPRFKILVTGSARLNVYKRGGDSLQGRYHYYRLHPFSAREMGGLPPAPIQPGEEPLFDHSAQAATDLLLRFGGFPEPLLAQTPRSLRRWQNERLERFFREDIRDLTLVQDIASMRLLSELLPHRAARQLSVNSLCEDLQVSHRAVSRWLDILEELYFSFRIFPYQTRRYRSLKKEPKLYLWDWSVIPDDGARLENLVASHLLKFCHYLLDSDGHKAELGYLRDLEKREVDFIVSCSGKPWFLVEVKQSDMEVSPALRYFQRKLGAAHAYQVVLRTNKDYISDGIRVLPAAKFLAGLA